MTASKQYYVQPSQQEPALHCYEGMCSCMIWKLPHRQSCYVDSLLMQKYALNACNAELLSAAEHWTNMWRSHSLPACIHLATASCSGMCICPFVVGTTCLHFWATICKNGSPYAIHPLSVCLVCLWRWCIVAKWLDGSRWNLAWR